MATYVKCSKFLYSYLAYFPVINAKIFSWGLRNQLHKQWIFSKYYNMQDSLLEAKLNRTNYLLIVTR